MKYLRPGFPGVARNAMDNGQIQPTAHLDRTDTAIRQTAKLGKFAGLQTHEIRRYAKVGESIPKKLLHPFRTRKMFAVDQMQRRNGSLCGRR